MVKTIINIMATTGLAIMVLAGFIAIYGFDLQFCRTVLLAFAANVVVHLGLLVIHKLEIKYLALEVFIDIAYTTIVIVVFGLAFDWFGATPLIIMVVMAIALHICALFLHLAYIKAETNAINKLLVMRNEKQKLINRQKHHGWVIGLHETIPSK